MFGWMRIINCFIMMFGYFIEGDLKLIEESSGYIFINRF